MRILLVEDDEALCAAVAAAVGAGGLPCGRMPRRRRCAVLHAPTDVRAVHSGQDAARTGWAFGAARSAAEGLDTPVLMTTALGLVGDRVDGLDAGADDYLVKPFDVRELLARVRALARRPAPVAVSGRPCCGDLTLDMGTLVLTGDKEQCTLSKKEAELLAALMENAGQTLSRSFLFGRVWGPAPT